MIAPGSRLGPYEVTAQVGAGGMGEVYRARDSRLDRTVAIKVLPARLSSDPKLRERFEREAKAISALSHPHICTLYDVGSHEGVDFLVMEYLEGDSLADRLAKGPLPVDQVIRYGVEIADALDRAHKAGIVHRDLKPGNVVLTRSGAKLLDFGLAKFSQPQSEPNAPTLAMTQQKPLTEEGSILGTFQYMAPEQIEGKDADARTDIFALGALLYEMATGKRAFEAKTRASLIASILDREPPPISTVQPLTPMPLERVIRMCLAKDPDDRWQSAHDVAAELKWIGATSSETIGPGVKRRARRAVARGTALLVAGLALGAAGTWLAVREQEAPRPLMRFSIQSAPKAPVHLRPGAITISPDGRYVVFRATTDAGERLYLRGLDSPAAVPIAGTEGAAAPVFSSDGRWILFRREQALMKVSRDGGTPSKVSNRVGLGADWEGETIVVNYRFGGGLYAIPANGGADRQIVKPNPSKEERAIVWPDLLPGGETVIATAWNVGSWDTAKIIAYSMKDGASKVLVDGGAYGRYSPTGHLLFLRGGNLMAASFDPKSLQVGPASVVLAGVAHSISDGCAYAAVSAAGHLVFAPGGPSEPMNELVWMTREGKSTPIVPTRRRYGSVSLAPDMRTAAVTIEDATYDIWQLDLERDSLTRLSYGGDDSDASWTPDGNRVVWESSRTGTYSFFWRAADNSSPEELLIQQSEAAMHFPSFTPDGSHLVYTSVDKTPDIWMIEVATKKARPLIATEFMEGQTSVSPDGRWLAYASNESGRGEVYVTSFPKPGARWQVSIDGGERPQWMPDGKEIVFRNDTKWLVVPIETGSRPRPGKPRLMFEGDYTDDYDIARDGRIAAIRNGPKATAAQLHVILNWGEELKRRVPTR